MLTAVVGIVVGLLVLAFVVAVTLDKGPPPADVAFAYEQAWDHLDFSSLWALSADELRDGLDRKAFVAAKEAAYAQRRGLGHLARSISVEEIGVHGGTAVAHTKVDLHDGDTARHEVHLAHRAGRWVVTEYHLRADAAST
ncbi:MAG: hypothetical protein FJW86_03975 [Actinobacteria bacterium]|nr:hypothetical protein [Actinomycetota bacterium]